MPHGPLPQTTELRKDYPARPHPPTHSAHGICRGDRANCPVEVLTKTPITKVTGKYSWPGLEGSSQSDTIITISQKAPDPCARWLPA